MNVIFKSPYVFDEIVAPNILCTLIQQIVLFVGVSELYGSSLVFQLDCQFMKVRLNKKIEVNARSLFGDSLLESNIRRVIMLL